MSETREAISVSGFPQGEHGPVRDWVAVHQEDESVANLIQRQRGLTREDLPRSEMSDFELANRVYLANRQDLDLIHWQTYAKERIRWLSVQYSDCLDLIATQRARIEELEGAGRALRDDLIVRAKFDGEAKTVCAGRGVWEDFCALIKGGEA